VFTVPDSYDDAALEKYINVYIDNHRAVFEGYDESGRPLIRPARPYCPGCLGEDHAGPCPDAIGSEDYR